MRSWKAKPPTSTRLCDARRSLNAMSSSFFSPGPGLAFALPFAFAFAFAFASVTVVTVFCRGGRTSWTGFFVSTAQPILPLGTLRMPRNQ